MRANTPNNFRRKKTFTSPSGEANAIDYKDLRLLKEYVMESGRIVPSRITGATAGNQRRISQEIKRARFLALLPYCDLHE